jgi:hypothetical protein
MKPLECIRKFFEGNGGRTVTVAEVKALSGEERKMLAALAAKELGVELE